MVSTKRRTQISEWRPEKGMTNSDPVQGFHEGQWTHDPLCGPSSLVSPA